jgi:2,4-dienoyl-CoA reductase (NADPH2)
MSYDLLLAPVTINGMKLDNRITMAPTRDTFATTDGFVTQAFTDFYLRRARGGPGMLVIGAVAVTPKPSPFNLRISDDRFVPGLKDFVHQVHEESDTKVCAQLFQWMKIALNWFQDINDMTAGDIALAIDNFEQGAIRTREAGFDAIELHGAHGYLLSESLSFKNKRQDGYGGNTDGRLALTSEIYQRLRKTLGADFPIGVRINGDDFIVDGSSLMQSTVLARRLAQMGLDYISVSAGGKYHDSSGLTEIGIPFPYPPVSGYSGFRAMPPAHMPEGVNVYLAAAVREAVREAGFDTPVIAAGRIPDPKFAESILREEKADLIALCRPLLRDPEWPNKMREGRDKEIQKCTYCNDCMDRIFKDKPALCKYLEM